MTSGFFSKLSYRLLSSLFSSALILIDCIKDNNNILNFTVHYSLLQCSTVPYSALQCPTVPYSSLHLKIATDLVTLIKI